MKRACPSNFLPNDLVARAAAQITGVKVHPVQTKHGMFVSAELAAACQEFLRAKRAGKRP